jgi:DNA-binding NarL/FixJ family response regulator
MQLIKGLSNKQIAAELGLAEKTVRDRLTHIYRKCGVKSDRSLIAQAGKFLQGGLT